MKELDYIMQITIALSRVKRYPFTEGQISNKSISPHQLPLPNDHQVSGKHVA